MVGEGWSYPSGRLVRACQPVYLRSFENHGLTGNYSPVIEDLLTESLSLRRRPQIRLKTVCINDGDKRFDGI